MIRIRFVGDGPLDEASIPPLVRSLLELHLDRAVHFEPCFRPWARLHDVRGYDKKVSFAIRQAEDAGEVGLVATVDRDRSRRGSRLAALREGRASARLRGHSLPGALGEANPHAEAWLIADREAVRQARGLYADEPIGGGLFPKGDLQALHGASGRADDSAALVWADVACRARPAIIESARGNGFGEFAADVRAELASVV